MYELMRISDLSRRRREQARRILDEMKKLVSSSCWIVVTYFSARVARLMSHGSSCSVLMRSYIMACQLSSLDEIRLKNWFWFILSPRDDPAGPSLLGICGLSSLIIALLDLVS